MVSAEKASTSPAVPACPTPLDAMNEDLCLLAEKSQAMIPGACICTLDDAVTNEAYAVFRADTPSDSSHAYILADILRGCYQVKLYHRYRLSLAYNIAHAFFKLCATPWTRKAFRQQSTCLCRQMVRQYCTARLLSCRISTKARYLSRTTTYSVCLESFYLSFVSMSRWNDTLPGRNIRRYRMRCPISTFVGPWRWHGRKT